MRGYGLIAVIGFLTSHFLDKGQEESKRKGMTSHDRPLHYVFQFTDILIAQEPGGKIEGCSETAADAGKGFLLGILDGLILFLYGVVPTFQPAHFGRVYAAYGGVFVVLSILWGWLIDKRMPDRFDLIGGFVCIAGDIIILY